MTERNRVLEAGRGTEPADAPEEAGAMQRDELARDVDYIFCPDCAHHVPCVRLESGAWLVECSRCVGECGLCSCGSSGSCQGEHGDPVQIHMYVARGERRQITSDEEIRNA